MEQKQLEAWTRRDLTIISLEGENCLVISCDSCGSIGLKDADAFKLAPRYVSKFTTRVALTEVICCGALPVSVTNGVANELEPTGEETILGIHDELSNAGLANIVLNGSTEENFKTSMTALAITVIGVAKKNELKFGHAVAGDIMILLGSPGVGTEVELESKGFYDEIRLLLPLQDVKEIVPVGSKGIAYEAQTLAKLNGIAFKPYKTEIDYFRSAGPATCMLVLCTDCSADKVLTIYPAGIVVGEMT